AGQAKRTSRCVEWRAAQLTLPRWRNTIVPIVHAAEDEHPRPSVGDDAIGGQAMSDVNRRNLLGAAAATAVGLLAAKGGAEAAGEDAEHELPTFRYAMEQQRGKVTEGGSAKEATVKQLPISKGLAGVSMRL